MTLVRYIVLDVAASVAFYTGLPGFALTLKDPSGHVIELFQPA